MQPSKFLVSLSTAIMCQDAQSQSVSWLICSDPEKEEAKSGMTVARNLETCLLSRPDSSRSKCSREKLDWAACQDGAISCREQSRRRVNKDLDLGTSVASKFWLMKDSKKLFVNMACTTAWMSGAYKHRDAGIGRFWKIIRNSPKWFLCKNNLAG